MLINLTRVGSFELEGKNRQDIGRAERGEIPSSDIAVETQEIFLDWALARDTLNSINSFYREPIVTYSYIGETEYNPFNCYSLDCYGCHPPPNLSIQFLISKINNATMAFSRCTNNDQTPNFMNWFQCNKFKASINGINITVGEISNISRRVPSNETIIIENPITIQQKNDLSLVLKKYEEQVGWLVPNFNLSNDEIIESHRLLAILSYKDKDIINKIKRDRVSIYIIPIEGDLNKQLAEGLKAAVSEIAKHMSMDESTVKMAFEKSKS